MRHTSGLHPRDRLTAVLGITVLAVAMVLLGSIAVAFYTHLDSDWWLRMGATSFFAAMGLSALVFITRLVGALRLPIWPKRDLSPGLRWTLAMLMPVDILAMGFGCGGCNLLCLSLLAGASMMVGLGVREVRRGVGAPLLLTLSLLYAIPHCLCANVINRWWIEELGASLNCYAFSLMGIGFAVLGLRGVWPRLALVLAAAPGGAAVAFGLGHHLLSYPWSRPEGRRTPWAADARPPHLLTPHFRPVPQSRDSSRAFPSSPSASPPCHCEPSPPWQTPLIHECYS